MKTINHDWRSAATAPRDRKILAFFEDFGWYPAAWSEDDRVWKAAKCKGNPGQKSEEPEWHESTFRDDELCWWREWPSDIWWREWPSDIAPRPEPVATP